MKNDSLSKACVAIIILWTSLGNYPQTECVRDGHEMRRFGFSKMISYFVEKIDQEKLRKQEAENKEAQRRYQIFKTFLENADIIGRTSVLKDFYSGRY